ALSILQFATEWAGTNEINKFLESLKLVQEELIQSVLGYVSSMGHRAVPMNYQRKLSPDAERTMRRAGGEELIKIMTNSPIFLILPKSGDVYSYLRHETIIFYNPHLLEQPHIDYENNSAHLDHESLFRHLNVGFDPSSLPKPDDQQITPPRVN